MLNGITERVFRICGIDFTEINNLKLKLSIERLQSRQWAKAIEDDITVLKNEVEKNRQQIMKIKTKIGIEDED